MDTPHLLVIAAVEAEVQRLKDCLKFLWVKTVGGRSLWCGQYGEIPVSVLTTGPGAVNTAQAMTACIEASKPLIILQTGCGGGFRSHGMRIGDVAIAAAEVDAHLGIESESGNPAVQPLPFPVLMRSGTEFRERYPLNPELAEAAVSFLTSAWHSRDIRIFTGSFVTVATVTATDQHAAHLFKAFSPFIESMEGSAAALLSLYYRIPLIEIRCVSNFVGKRNLAEWDLSLACARAGEASATLLPFIKLQFEEILKAGG